MFEGAKWSKSTNMKAMILAAGLGTRLDPLTRSKPKALVPVGNRAIIDRVIEYLKSHGVTEIVVNAHHHYQQIVKHLDSGRPFGLKIQVRVEPVILGTGGGIGNTQDFWDSDPFIVINGDILTNIDLAPAYEEHCRRGSLVTLVLHDRPPFNQVQVDAHANIIDIGRQNRPGRLAFTGIHILEPKLLDHIPKGVFSNIIDCYRRLMNSGNTIKAYVARNHYWTDIGTIATYIRANMDSLEGKASLLGSHLQIHSSARIEDWAIIGDYAHLEEKTRIASSVLWENVKVRRGKQVIGSIVTSSKEVVRDLIQEIL